jgi:hypothetical protein
VPLPENERELIKCLQFWVLQHPKKPEDVSVPTNHTELLSFIARLFIAFQKEEKETWSQLSTLHLLTPSMVQLYQKKFTQIQTMNWIQLLCYKTVACPNGKTCRSFREQKMLHNQFYDFELECPFFHDKKDKRRIILPEKPQEEFMYKGKYQEGVNEESMDASFSHNYFESVFHPLFYKFFDCKRVQCRGSIHCPMKHTEEERIAWEEEFSLNWRKDRSIYYPKKKNYSDGSDTSIEEKHHGKKQHQKQKGHKKHNNNFTQQTKKNTSNYDDYRSKENFENFSQKNLDFFESEPSGESKFLKFFSAENSNENPGRNTNNTADDSSKNVYKYFPTKENQPLMEIQNFFSNTSSSNNHNMEPPFKRLGFHNEKKGSQNMRNQHQNMRNQNQNKHIEVK